MIVPHLFPIVRGVLCGPVSAGEGTVAPGVVETRMISVGGVPPPPGPVATGEGKCFTRARGEELSREVRDRLGTLGKDAQRCVGTGAIKQVMHGRLDIRARGQVGAAHNLVGK